MARFYGKEERCKETQRIYDLLFPYGLKIEPTGSKLLGYNVYVVPFSDGTQIIVRDQDIFFNPSGFDNFYRYFLRECFF